MNNKQYDLKIIGSGASGLTCALLAAKIGKKVLIIEKESIIGGCHSVLRKNGLFSEHAPRIYSDNYINFKGILKLFGLNFNDVFAPYNFNITNIGGNIIKQLHAQEIGIIIKDFIIFLVYPSYKNNITLYDYMISNNFSKESIDLLNRLSILSDGGDSTRITVDKFFNLINQHFNHKLYLPREPTDLGLLKIWQKHLEDLGVDFQFNTKYMYMSPESCPIVFCIPPEQLLNTGIQKGTFKGLDDEFVNDTKYNDYTSIIFHWDSRLKLPKIYGFPKSEWGLIFIDYTNYYTNESGTIISCAITLFDPKNMPESSIVQESFKQLREAFPQGTLPDFSKYILNRHSVYSAYLETNNKTKIPFKSPSNPTLYTVGTHNGFSHYKFTSMESAVSNAIEFCNQMYPETKNIVTLTSATDLRSTIGFIISIIIIYMVLKKLS